MIGFAFNSWEKEIALWSGTYLWAMIGTHPYATSSSVDSSSRTTFFYNSRNIEVPSVKEHLHPALCHVFLVFNVSREWSALDLRERSKQLLLFNYGVGPLLATEHASSGKLNPEPRIPAGDHIDRPVLENFEVWRNQVVASRPEE